MSDEYQQNAALMAMDIDILAQVAENKEWDADFLREMIFRLKRQKDEIITNEEVRESRYKAASSIFNIGQKKDG